MSEQAPPGSTGSTSFPIRGTAAPAAILILAGLAAYSNSMQVPFVFDDTRSILENRSITDLRSIRDVLSPPRGPTVEGRPLLNLTLAVNYAIGGHEVAGYHAMNLAIHILAALALFGIARRTLGLPATGPRIAGAAPGLALAIALAWLLHPLQTESVTYVVQRAESLMGLFYLLALYCAIRGAGSPRRGWWHAGAVAACGLGMGCKEVTASAPIMILLYDRIFLFASFREALRRRRLLYAGLAATWAVLAAGLLATGAHAGTAEIGNAELTPLQNAMTQCRIVTGYLALVFRPHPLVFDYGRPDAGVPVIRSLAEFAPWGGAMLALAAGTLAALRYWPPIGFLGVWFAAILAPSSSFVPIVTQPAAEHRMYLALAPVAALAVVGAHAAGRAILDRLVADGARRASLARACGFGAAAGVALALGTATFLRNEDYRSDRSLWTDTVAKAPGNPRAHSYLAQALAAEGLMEEALEHSREAVRLRPDFYGGHYNLANVLVRMGAREDAVLHYREAVRLHPDFGDGHNNLASALASVGKAEEAVPHFLEALRLNPESAVAHGNFAGILNKLGRSREAVPHCREALRLKPDSAPAHYHLGTALAALGQADDAAGEFREALRLNPDFAEAHCGLAGVLAAQGRPGEAVPHFEAALRLKPGLSQARQGLERIRRPRENP